MPSISRTLDASLAESCIERLEHALEIPSIVNSVAELKESIPIVFRPVSPQYLPEDVLELSQAELQLSSFLCRIHGAPTPFSDYPAPEYSELPSRLNWENSQCPAAIGFDYQPPQQPKMRKDDDDMSYRGSRQYVFSQDGSNRRPVALKPKVFYGILGQGGFGKVLLARLECGTLVAVKVTHKPKYFRAPGARKALLLELDILRYAANQQLSFATPLVSSWEDHENVYFTMVRATLVYVILFVIIMIFPTFVARVSRDFAAAPG